jgi:hypothetical protein
LAFSDVATGIWSNSASFTSSVRCPGVAIGLIAAGAHAKVGRVAGFADVVHVLAIVERRFVDVVVLGLSLAVGDVEEAPHRRRAEEPALPSRVVPSGILAFGTRDIITECRLVRTRPGTRPRSRCARSAGVAAEKNFPSWTNGSSVQERVSTSTAFSMRSRLSSLRRPKPTYSL